MNIPPWSFSTINSYMTCPFKYYAAKVSKKYPDESNEASIWGNRVHKALEERLLHKTTLPVGMDQWEPIVALFDEPSGELLVEHKLAIDKKFEPCDWDNSWARCIIDVALLRGDRAKAYDWKTGKIKPGSQQLALSSAILMHVHPSVKIVDTGYVWLQYGDITPASYHRGDLSDFWAEFLPNVRKWERSFETGKWEKKPSGLCRDWCSNKECNFYQEKKK